MANANRGLGKGLGALLGDAALRTDTSDNLYLPISQIEPYANQPRRHFDEEALQDLADSIREHGIIPVSYTHLDVYKRQARKRSSNTSSRSSGSMKRTSATTVSPPL